MTGTASNRVPANDNPPGGQWDRTAFKAYTDGLPPGRVEDDRKKLSRLFLAAAKVPAARAALDWAFDHGVEFIIDRNMGAAGQYHAGTGVLAVSEEMFAPGMLSEVVGTLTHEIRHAWQDWHGLLPNTANGFLDFYVRQAVLEADAHAYGFLAYHQHEYADAQKHLERAVADGNKYSAQYLGARVEQMAGALKKPEAVLWRGFNDWFSSDNPEMYGRITLQGVAAQLGLADVAEDALSTPGLQDELRPPEFSPQGTTQPPLTGVDIASADSLAPLGKSFEGRGNYFRQGARDFIEKGILSRKAAAAFYKQGAKPHPLVEEVTQAEKKYAANRPRPF